MVDKVGKVIDGSQFKLGIAYLNFTFPTKNGQSFTLEYEPVLISHEYFRSKNQE